ncbi:hypothetical protein EI94DRAFT_1703644 [Lactarius quietus]|nr:hypothetical protein EI94DRAFT_1703644 [Lactarius quietus]
METNLEQEQADTLSQSSVKPCLSTQVRVVDAARDVKVSALSIFALVGSTDWLKKLKNFSLNDEAPTQERPDGSLPTGSKAMSQPSSPATVKPNADAHKVLGNTDIVAYLDDLDHDLTMVECKAGWNNTNIQETTQCLIILERKLLKTNTVINRYLLRQEDRQLGRNTTMMGENLAETIGVLLVVVISLCFVTMATKLYGAVHAAWTVGQTNRKCNQAGSEVTSTPIEATKAAREGYL